MQNTDATCFVVMVCVPLVARVLMVPRIGRPVGAWSLKIGERLWAHVIVRDEPDELVLRRWALVRLDELEGHLARVKRLVVDDEAMSATRQLGNRLAYERLLVDVAAAFVTAPERVFQPPTPAWQSMAQVRYLARPVHASSSTVEILEF